MMNGGALAKERWTQIFFDRNTVKGRPREFIRSFHRPLPVVAAQAKHVLVRKALYRVERALSAKRIEKFEKGILALSANDKVHVAGVECSIRIDRCEIAAPANGDFRMKTADLTGGLHCCHHLRTRHCRDAHQFDRVPIDEVKNASGRILFEVPVDDLVFLSSFQDRSEG